MMDEGHSVSRELEVDLEEARARCEGSMDACEGVLRVFGGEASVGDYRRS